MVEAVGDDVKVYEVTSRASKLPSWQKSATAKERRKRRLEEAKASAAGVQILQDFEMPSVSHKVRLSEDKNFLLVTGTYAPMVKCFEVNELSMKFQRNLDCEIVDFAILEPDWKKLAFLLASRVIEIHSQAGFYYKVRVPRFGREMHLHPSSSELYVCGEGEEVYRLNMEHGKFMAPLVTKSGAGGGNNCLAVNPINQLMAFGGEDGVLEAWDPRDLSRNKAAGTLKIGAEVTAMSFDSKHGLNLTVGTGSGQVLVYDIRSSKPYVTKEQGYGLPIRSVKMHRDGEHVISCDAKSIKAWSRTESSKNLFAVEPKADVNHLCLVGDSGLVIAAAETSRVLSYYVPALGLAPKWCSFLDNFTEELEEGSSKTGNSTVYENYRFVTMDELKKLNLEHIVGTNLVRGYMHGYFMDLRLWRKAQEAAEPFAYEQYRKQKIREKIEEERSSRISTPQRSRKVKVNQRVIDEALKKAQRKKGGAAKAATAAITDNRFKAMFEDDVFEVDEEDARYRRLHPQDDAPALDDGDVDSDLELEEEEDIPDPMKLLQEDARGLRAGMDSSEGESEVEGSADEEESRPISQPRLYGIKAHTLGSKPDNMSAVRIAKGIKTSASRRESSRRKRETRMTLGERVRPQ
ncbi:hypothetical protein NDN08_003999 [Rhodosorus marinus]|uniref:NUC153 domain-containing protein n=1 Tax=Rhodosorus marinus TaxID=101924 RepID=A0AAV8UL08_9RHOD|nr:hypothetical protein NDN08_003999 [Rhodosorus marinus]